MKTVIIVSECIEVSHISQSEVMCQFHFKGTCAGEPIRGVLLRAHNGFQIVEGREYLIYAQLQAIDDGTLHGVVIKCREMSECWDRPPE